MSKKFYDSLSGRNKKQGKNFSSKKSQKKASQTARISGRGLGRATRPNQKSSAETKEKTQTSGTKVFKNVSKPEKQTAVIPPARTKKAGKNFHTTGSQQRASDTARVWGRGLDRNNRKSPSSTKKYTDFTTSNGNLPLTNTQRKTVAASVGQQLEAEHSKYRKTKKNWENVRLNKKDISAYRKDLAQQKEDLEKTKKYYNDLAGIDDLKQKKQALNDKKFKLAQAYTRGEDTTDLVKDALQAERELDEAEHPVYLREDGEKRDSKAEKALRDKAKETKSDYNKKKWRYDSMTANNFSAARAGDRPLQTDLDKVDKARAAMDKAQAKYDKADIAYQDYEYKGKLYDDTFSGEFAANYRASDLHQKAALAYTNYIRHMDDPGSESLKEKADALNAIAESIAQANAGTMGDKSTVARDFFANAQATHLPQLKGQFKDMAAGAVYGGLTGAAIGTAAPGVGTAAGAATGIKAGIAAGSAKYAYDTTMGMVFKSLIDLGLDEHTAAKAAKDEALVSSAVEMADTFGDLATLGGYKFIDVVAKEGVKGIVRRTGSKEAGNIVAKFLKGLGKYGISVGQEGLEEGIQEVVSIGNEHRAQEQVQTAENVSNYIQDRAGRNIYSNLKILNSERSIPEQIAQNKKRYEAARAAGDPLAMRAANDENNRIRTLLGKNLEVASGDIASVAEQQGLTNPLDEMIYRWHAPDTSGMNASQSGIPGLLNESFNPLNKDSVVNKLRSGDTETTDRVIESTIAGMKTAVISNGTTMVLTNTANYNLTKTQYESVARNLAKNGSGAQSEIEKAQQLADYAEGVAYASRGVKGKNAISASDAAIGKIAIENQKAINNLLTEIGNSDTTEAKQMAQQLNKKQATGGNITAADIASLRTLYAQEIANAAKTESDLTGKVDIPTGEGKTTKVDTSLKNPETGLEGSMEKTAKTTQAVNPQTSVLSGIQSMYVSADQGKVSTKVAAHRAEVMQRLFKGEDVSEKEIQSLNLHSPATKQILNKYTGSKLTENSGEADVRAVINQAKEMYDTRVMTDQIQQDEKQEQARVEAQIQSGMNAYADDYLEQARQFIREEVSNLDSNGNLEMTYEEFSQDYQQENPQSTEDEIHQAYKKYLEDNLRMDFEDVNYTHKQVLDYLIDNGVDPDVAEKVWQKLKTDYTDQGRVVDFRLLNNPEEAITGKASYQNIRNNMKQGMTKEEARQTELQRIAYEAGEKARKQEIEHTAEYLSEVTKRFGIESVEVAYDMPDGMNGDIQWTDGKAYIRINGNAVNSERATIWVFTHEVFHQGSKGNENLTELFLSALQEMQKEGLLTRELSAEVAAMDLVQQSMTEDYLEYEREVRGNDGSKVTPAYVREEMAADWMADLMNSSDMLSKMAGKRPGILARLSDRLTYTMLDMLGQNQYEEQQKQIGSIQRQLIDALTEAGKEKINQAKGTDSEPLLSYRTMKDDYHKYKKLMEETHIMSPEEFENLFGVYNTKTGKLTQKGVIDQILDYMDAVRLKDEEEGTYNIESIDLNEEYETDEKGGRLDDRAFTPYKDNSDPLYVKSFDLSTMCRKRIMQQMIHHRLEKILGKPLTQEEQIGIRERLVELNREMQRDEEKLEVACHLCYVESARLKSPKAIKRFLDNPQSMILNYFAGMDPVYKEHLKQVENDAKIKLGLDPKTPIKSLSTKQKNEIWNQTKAAKENYYAYLMDESNKIVDNGQTYKIGSRKMSADEVNQERAEYREVLSRIGTGSDGKPYIMLKGEKSNYVAADFSDPNSLINMINQDPLVYKAFSKYLVSATRAKGIEGHIAYFFGDAESGLTENLIEKMNKENGLRSQSWSDFEPKHILDYISGIIELSAKRAKMHAYTKVPDYVRFMGRTDQIINMSLIPDAKGLGWDNNEGMPYEIALELRKEFPETAGTIAIGLNDEQILKMLEDDTIDYVIPYHSSGLKKSMAHYMGIGKWVSYQLSQNEKPVSGKKSDYVHINFSDWFDLERARKNAKRYNQENAAAYRHDKTYGAVKAMRDEANNYLKICEEKGQIPKFYDKGFHKADNYWKLLIDRKMINQETGELIEQKPVKPIFDFDTIRQILDRELNGYNALTAKRNETLEKVTTEFMQTISGNYEIEPPIKIPKEKTKKISANAIYIREAMQQTKTFAELSESAKSYRQDSSGAYLTKQQIKAFGDSVLRDGSNRLIRFYAEDDVNEKGIFKGFADKKSSGISWSTAEREAGNGKNIAVYLYATNPIDLGVLSEPVDTFRLLKKNVNTQKNISESLQVQNERLLGITYRIQQDMDKAVTVKDLASDPDFIALVKDAGYDSMIGTETFTDTSTGTQVISPTATVFQPKFMKLVENQTPHRSVSDSRASLSYDVNARLEKLYGENQDLKNSNQNLARQLNNARRNLKRTTEPTANERSTAREARSLAQNYNSSLSLKEIRKALGELYTESQKTDMRTADDQTFQAFYQKVDDLAQRILEEASVEETPDREVYDRLKNRLKGETVYVSPDTDADFAQFDGYNDFRKTIMGKLNLSREEGIPVDELYQALAEEFPGYFDDANGTADQLDRIRNVLDQLKPKERDLTKAEQQEQRQDLIQDILASVYKRIQAAPKTKMDKMLETQQKKNDHKLNAEKQKHQRILQKAELDKWKLADEYEKKLQEEKSKSQKKLDAQKATWQSRLMREKKKERMRYAQDMEAKRMADARKIAEIRRSKWEAIQKQSEEYTRKREEQRILNRKEAKDAKNTIEKRDKLENLRNQAAKTPHDKLNRGQADKLRDAFKTPPENLSKTKKALDKIKSGYNTFYRNFVSATKELEDFSKLQTEGIKVDNMVNLIMGQSGTIDALYQNGFVLKDGTVDREAGAMKDVFLCYDEKGKYDAEAQAKLHNYMLLMHTVDRMSFEERAERALTDFEEKNAWITTLEPKDEVAIAAAHPGKELDRLTNGLPENSQDLVKEHLKLLKNSVEAKNKPVFESKEKGKALSAADAQDRATEMLADDPWLQEKAEEIYSWWDRFMREWAVGTSITEADYQTMQEMYPHYVPTYRADKKNLTSAVFVGANNASVGQVVKKAKGGFSEIVPIEDSFADMARRIIHLNRSNEILYGIIASARSDRDGTLDGYSVFDDTMDNEVAALNKTLMDMNLLNGDVRETVDPKKMLEDMGDGTYRITCWENGEQISAYVSKEMFKSISYTLGKQPLGEGLTKLSKLGATLTNPMKTAITGINPMFALRNISRDIPTAIIYGSSGVFGSAHLIWTTKAVKEIMTNSENWQTYQALGGNHAQYYNNEKGFSNAVGVSGRSKNPFVMAAKGAAAVRDKMGAFNETTEAMNRFGEYLATIDRMGDTYEGRLQGMKNAAEITVDFSRKGYYGGLLNSWIPYWNPAVQGIDKVFRSVGLEFSEKISKQERLHRVLRSIPRIAITTAVPELVLYAVMKSQDDYDDWKELSDRTKDTYYCIPIPGEHKYLKIPKNREWGTVIGDPLMRLLEWADGDFKDENPFANWVEDALKTNFLPPMIVSYDADTRKWESDIIGLGTALELQANRDFANRRIVSADLEDGSLKNQYDEDTSWLAKQLGELLNFSPQQADYILGSYFGDFAKIVQTATSRHMDWSKSGVGNSLRESLLSPWIGYSTVSNQMVSDYYDLMDDLSTAATDEANGRVEGTAATDAQKAIQKLYGDRIKELNTKAREAESQKERLEAKEDLVKVIGEAYAYYGDIASGKIQDPLTDAKYHDYDPAVRDMLSDLKDFEDYKFKPSEPSENSKDKRISDPANDSKKFTLTGDQWAEYIDTYRKVYNATMAELVQSEAYQNAKTLEEKAALAEKARDSVSGKAKEQTAAALKQQGVKSSIDVEKWKKKNSSYQASVQDELIRLNNAEGKKYNVDPDSRDSVKAVTLNGTGTEFVLDDAARDQYEKIYNDMLDSAYNSVISGSKYRNVNDDGKVSLLQETRKRVRSKAKTSMIKWLRTNGYAVTPKAN